MKLIFLSALPLAHGHGAMNFPRPRNTNAAASWSADASCLGEACYWYQVRGSGEKKKPPQGSGRGS